MTIQEKKDINKIIRKYEGTNSFILSLQKQLRNSKYLTKETDENGKLVKVLSSNQYLTALQIIKN